MIIQPAFQRVVARTDGALLALACLLACAFPLGASRAGEPIASVNAPGEIRVLLVPRQEATLSSQLAARIESMPVASGGRFHKGDLLVRFNCEITRARLKKAEAQLKATQLTLNANRKLEKFHSISALKLAVSETDVARAQAEAALTRAQVNRCLVRAPMRGRVVKWRAKPFESVAEGQPLIEILDDSRLRLQLFVPSRWLLWLAEGTVFTVHIDETGKTYRARVVALGARVDPVSQTLEVRAEIVGRHHELLAGMSGAARFDVPEAPGHKP